MTVESEVTRDVKCLMGLIVRKGGNPTTLREAISLYIGDRNYEIARCKRTIAAEERRIALAKLLRTSLKTKG